MQARVEGVMILLGAMTATACSTSNSIEEGNSPAGNYTYCEALTATCNSSYAGTPTACSQAARDQCSTFQPTYSQAFQNAVVSCAKSFSPCIADFYDCIGDRTSSATPTAVQVKVKADFCAVCPDEAGSGAVGPCSTFFNKDADAGVGTYGLGIPVLKVNDTIAAEIGTMCIGVSFSADGGVSSSDGGVSGGCDWLAFAACMGTLVRARTTPSACQPDGG